MGGEDFMFKLSVILNYGCPFSCSYCIWSGHKCSKDISRLENFNFGNFLNIIRKDECHELVSISGGGDPLFNSHNPKSDQYQLLLNILNILKEEGKNVSLHTRFRKIPPQFISMIDQFVLSYDNLTEIGFKDFALDLALKNKVVRIAKVMIEDDYDYKRDLHFAEENGLQITFYPYNKDKSVVRIAKEVMNMLRGYHKSKLVTEGNQKIYLMPNNKLYNDYGAKEIIVF
jgi:organic radical activating enzyme